LSLLILLAALFAACGLMLLGLSQAERLAFALVPFEYPGSILVSTARLDHSNANGEVYVYYASASPDEVVRYFEERLPDFSYLAETGWYLNSVADNSLLGHFAAIPSAGGPPRVTIWIRGNDREGGTRIEIHYIWPRF
jgi:hypothetical protein